MTGGAQAININFNGVPATPLQLILFAAYKLTPLLLNWIAAIGLWIFAREVAVRLFENGPSEGEDEPTLAVGTEVRAIAFSCLGLFFLMQDVPVLVLWLLNQVWEFVRLTSSSLPFNNIYFSWERIIRIPFSLWLVFGLRGLAGLWRLAQEKGVAPNKMR